MAAGAGSLECMSIMEEGEIERLDPEVGFTQKIIAIIFFRPSKFENFSPLDELHDLENFA